jgi:hypothetical protein
VRLLPFLLLGHTHIHSFARAPAPVPPAWPHSRSHVLARAPARNAEVEKAACFKRGHCARAGQKNALWLQSSREWGKETQRSVA